MSVMMNGFEKHLCGKLQAWMTKREAQNAVLEIREGLYDDCCTMIGPVHIIEPNGEMHEDFPDIGELINAYYTGDYDRWR